jgi:hypothetical protein
MGYWLHRFVRSRRVRVAALGGIGLLTMGCCGGSLLASYTVSGINPFYASRLETPDIQPSRGAADWLAEEAFRSTEQDRAKAELADPWKPEATDGQSY